jgi:cyclic-di-AMP phosphodiesterase PgpH
MGLLKKTNLRRNQVRKSIAVDKPWFSSLVDADVITSTLIWLVYVGLCVLVTGFEMMRQSGLRAMMPTGIIIMLLSAAVGFYIHHYEARMIRNHARAIILTSLFLLLLIATKIGVISAKEASWSTSWATGTAVMVGIVLAIAYDQRFAIDMGIFYSLYACLAIGAIVGPAATVTDVDTAPAYQLSEIGLLLTMVSGVITCGFSLREIRTRMKLLEVSTLTAAVVFVTAAAVGHLSVAGQTNVQSGKIIYVAGCHAGFVFLVGLFVQSFLPLLEKLFRIATSMTLLDYSDANQPLLKKLAMETPGTYSHSLLIGSISEAAAEAIDCNGLLCRVGAYYHDIGKMNKPTYFIENQPGSTSRHKVLSPTMSQLIIVGHVKDGIEMAKEYKLPAVIRQFIETHHGTTLIEPFYNEAKKQHEAPANGTSGQKKPKVPPPSESEFRYAGPKPKSKEAAIVMLADAVEGAVRSLAEVTPSKVETVVHNMAMKRLQDGQFDECDITLRELSRVEVAMAKALAAHYHGRIAYPTAPDDPNYLKPEKEKKNGDKEKEAPGETKQENQEQKDVQKV